MKPFDEELVSGSITRSVWKLAWPMVALNLVNGLHGLVDHILVGNFVVSEDKAANAAIGVAWQLFLVIVVLISSLYHGMSVLVARYAGKQDRETLSHVAYHTFLSSVIILAVLAPFGYLLTPRLLGVVNATPEVIAHARPYMRILFVLGMPLFLMFMLTGAMQASGDPRTPLVLGILATLLNIVLSAVLITGLGPIPKLGATGAALATCLAPLVSVLIALRLIMQHKLIIQPPRRLLVMPDLSVLRVVARIGLPTGLGAVVLNLGGVFLLRYIGSLEHSAAAQAAFTICYAQLFSIVQRLSWGLRNAASTMIGQNIGAGNLARGKKGVHVAALFGAVCAFGMGMLYWWFSYGLMGFFGATEGPVVDFGTSLLRYLAVSGVFLASALGYTGGLIGAGETRKPTYIAFVTQIIVLLGLCQIWSSMGRLSTDAIWIFILVSHAARLALTFIVFQRGRWARIKVEIRH